jgi:hypothetical protein
MAQNIDTVRRAMLGGAGLIATVAATGTAAFSSAPNTLADLERHFSAWKSAITFINSSRYAHLSGKQEVPLWRQVDGAETAIVKARLQSPRVAAMRLWVALEHLSQEKADSDAICREDLAHFLANEEDRDWEDRTIIGALRALVGEG